MKFLHFTDIHLTRDGETVEGRDPRRSFAAALEHAAAHHADAEFAIVTGDLANWGDIEAYEYLRDRVAAARWPLRLVLGNHDDRQRFLTAFPDHPRDRNGFVQYVFTSTAGRMIVLDTVEPETHAGRLCERRLAWLEAQLDASTAPAMLFMHHHPLPTHVPAMDLIGLMASAPFRELVATHRKRIGHIFFGHCHLPLSGSLAGVPVSSLRGTHHQSWPDFAHPSLLSGGNLAPMYGVVFAEADHVTVHAVDFTYAGPVRQMPTDYAAWAKPMAADLPEKAEAGDD